MMDQNFKIFVLLDYVVHPQLFEVEKDVIDGSWSMLMVLLATLEFSACSKVILKANQSSETLNASAHHDLKI